MIDDFKDKETRKLALRLLYRNFPEKMTSGQSPDYINFLKRINPDKETDALVDYKGKKKYTPSDAILEIEQLKKEKELDHRFMYFI